MTVMDRTEVSRQGAAISPVAALIAAVLVCATILLLPIVLPVGPMYWDLLIYFDGANRIGDGQLPVVDFFAPVGPLGYYLFAGILSVFPNGQPLLLVHWSTLAVTLPLLVLVLRDVQDRSAGLGWALLVPFLLFALLPFNSGDFYPYPGSDAFGIYNRQVCQVLYVLMAALIFVENRVRLGFVVLVSMAALFLLKITGFAAAGVLCVFAVAAGRLRIATAAIAAGVFLAFMAMLEIMTGFVSTYLIDIMALVAKNSESLLGRFAQAMSLNFGVVAPALLLAGLLFWLDRDVILRRIRGSQPLLEKSATLLDHDACWIGAAVFAGIFFETQNTGSQALILLWPVMVRILRRRGIDAAGGAVVLLSAASLLPPAVTIFEKASRAWIGGLRYEALDHRNLKTIGSISVRQTMMERAHRMTAHYEQHRDAYRDLVQRGELPSFIFYSEFDFQAAHLMAIDRAITRLLEIERQANVRFETIMNLNFVNPFPYLMDRSAPKHIAIGADPMRAVPDPGSDELRAVRDTDLVLRPTCPPTTANDLLHEIYAAGLTQHTRMQITPCFEAWLHPRLAARVGKLEAAPLQ